MELFLAAVGVSAAMVATPGIAYAEGEEGGGPGPAAAGEEQPVANEVVEGNEPGSSNEPAAEAPPAVVATSGEVKESTTIEQGSSPAVVISTQGGPSDPEDEEDEAEARPFSRQPEAPITGTIQQNSPGSVPPALAGPSLMQANVEHPPGHGGGGDPAPVDPTPPPLSTPAPYNLSPASHLFNAFKAAIEPMMAQDPHSLDSVLLAYLVLSGYRGAAPDDPYTYVMGNWNSTFNPALTTIEEPKLPQGTLSMMIESMGAGMEPMMSPAFDPLWNLYASFLVQQQLQSVPTSAFDLVIENWKAKLAAEQLKTTCKADPRHEKCGMDPDMMDAMAAAMTEEPFAGVDPYSAMLKMITTLMKPMVSPAFDPLILAYSAFILPVPDHGAHGDDHADHLDVAEHGDHENPEGPELDPYDAMVQGWVTTVLHNAQHQALMRKCKRDSHAAGCHEMAHGAGGHNHGGGGSMGSMGPMSMTDMIAMMSQPKMPEMDHGACMGGTFLMCNQPAGVETTYNDHDVMFLNHMIPHHGQAVLMSRIVLGMDDLDPRVAALAEQIKAAQGPEIRQMQSWLDSWGNPPSDMVGDHGILPPEDILALRQANGADASVLFLQQMIYHHKGAVDASIGHLMGGQFDPSMQLAHDIIGVQNTEIQTMTDLLDSLGAPMTGPNVPEAPSGGQVMQPSGGGSSSGSGDGGHHH